MIYRKRQGKSEEILPGAELLAKEFTINTGEIQKLKPYEAYIGIGKKSHKVLMFPGVETAEYKPEPEMKLEELDFLEEGWIEFFSTEYPP